MTFAHRTLAVGALAGLLAVAGCSSSVTAVQTPAPITSGAPTDSKASSTASAPGAPSTVASTVAAPAPGSTVDPAALSKQAGDAAKTVKTATVAMQTESNGAVVSSGGGVADLNDPNAPKVQMEITMGGQKIQVVTIGTTQYTKMPGAAKWTKSTAPAGSNPADSIRNNVAYDTATYVGPDTVDGTAVRKYAVTISASGQTIPAEIYLDAKSLLRKTVTNIGTGATAAKATVTFSKYNEPVTVTEPPAAEVQ